MTEDQYFDAIVEEIPSLIKLIKMTAILMGIIAFGIILFSGISYGIDNQRMKSCYKESGNWDGQVCTFGSKHD